MLNWSPLWRRAVCECPPRGARGICIQFQKDIETCGITLTSSEISKMKESKLVYSQLNEISRDYLLAFKLKHSELSNLTNSYKLEQYLTSDQITTEEKQPLLKLRTRMVDVKVNFKTYYGPNLTCRFCLEEESHPDLLICKEIVDGTNVRYVDYEDILPISAQAPAKLG